MDDRPEPLGLFYHAGRRLLDAFLCACFRVEVVGFDNLPVQGACLVAANHKSNWDPFLLGTVLGRRRPAYFIAKRELFHNKILGALLVAIGSVAIDRRQADVGAMRGFLNLLRDGELIAVFPEGTRKREHRLARFLPGIGFLAQKSGADIVPAFITDFGATPSLGARIRIVFGSPVKVAALAGADAQGIAYTVLQEFCKLA